MINLEHLKSLLELRKNLYAASITGSLLMMPDEFREDLDRAISRIEYATCNATASYVASLPINAKENNEPKPTKPKSTRKRNKKSN